MPAYDLDCIVYDADTGERPAPEIARRLDQVRRQAGWVTEGAYGEEWLTALLDDADAIVWLDLPLRICLARIVTRHVRAELARNNPHAGWRKLLRFLNYTRRTARGQNARTRTLLSRYGSKVVRCRSSGEVDVWRSAVSRTR